VKRQILHTYKTRINVVLYRISHKSTTVREYTEKCKEEKVIANSVLPVSSVGMFHLGRAATHFTLSIVKSYGDVATLT
jgi:hypothetical protein